MTFSWKSAKERVPAKMLQRYGQLARCNPTALPVNLVKELLNDSIKKKVETEMYINKKVEKNFKYGKVPKPSIEIKRMNRVV